VLTQICLADRDQVTENQRTDSLRTDLIRPWTRRRWSWVVQGTLLWRFLALLGALWSGTTVGLCVVSQLQPTMVLWVLLSVLSIPLLAAFQAVQKSVASIGAITLFRLASILMLVLLISLTSGSVLSWIIARPWPELVLVLLIANVVAVGLVHLRWKGLDIV
jgi:hypothetical protein